MTTKQAYGKVRNGLSEAVDAALGRWIEGVAESEAWKTLGLDLAAAEQMARVAEAAASAAAKAVLDFALDEKE